MKYSVIVSTYHRNKEQYENLLATVQSIRKNSPKDIELIIVNDGSTYGNQAVESFQIDTYVRHGKNMGIPATWNDGLKVARGEYVTICNDDIVVEEGWLDKLRVALEDDQDNMVAAPGVKDQSEGTGILEDYQWFPGYCFMLKWGLLANSAYSWYIGNDGLFDEQFAPFDFEDTDYWTRVLAHGGKLVRNFNTTIEHVGGHVLHTLDYDKVNEINNAKFQKKWGFDPIPVFYYNKEFDFSTL